MNTPTAQLFVAVENGVVYIRVVGRGTFASGVDFKTLLENVIQRGHSRIIVDLAECPLMDSTFIGLLATFGMQLTPSPQRGISLLRANDRIRGLLANLGVDHLFVQCTPGDELPSSFTPQQTENGGARHVELQRTCLEAHQKLMEANPENVSRFKDVTRFLAEDLKKAEADQAAGSGNG